jgi:hypothetical protein
MNILEIALGQLLALVTFFAFPVIQYIWLKSMTKKEGQPALFYLPDYGFRLVIRNLPRKKTLSDIKYKTYVRRIVPASTGASVATYEDKNLVIVDDFFLFGGIDQVLISFKLAKKKGSEKLYFVHTDKLGNEKEWIAIDDITFLISEYTANIENLFNFDVKVAKHVRIKADLLKEIWQTIQQNNYEQSFQVSEVRNIG